MSFSKPDSRLQNPVTKYLEWKSSLDSWVWYDKENEVNVPYDLSHFIVLDYNIMCLKGLKQEKIKGIKITHQYWSNDVRRWRTDANEDLTIRLKGSDGLIAEGEYKDIKLKAKDLGAKFAIRVYIMLADGELGQLFLQGSSLASDRQTDTAGWCPGWFQFEKKWSPKFTLGSFSCVGSVEDETAGNSYLVPVFAPDQKITEAETEQATELDRILQEYLTQYFGHLSKAQDSEADSIAKSKADAPEDDDVSESERPHTTDVSGKAFMGKAKPAKPEDKEYIFWSFDNEEEVVASYSDVASMIADNELSDDDIDKLAKWKASDDDDWHSGLELFKPELYAKMQLEKAGKVKPASSLLGSSLLKGISGKKSEKTSKAKKPEQAEEDETGPVNDDDENLPF